MWSQSTARRPSNRKVRTAISPHRKSKDGRAVSNCFSEYEYSITGEPRRELVLIATILRVLESREINLDGSSKIQLC